MNITSTSTSTFAVGDIVQILYSKNPAGNCCIAVATISEIHDTYVKVIDIRFFTGNAVMNYFEQNCFLKDLKNFRRRILERYVPVLI